MLAAVGIFGVTTRMVSARRRELGIRLALGARPVEVTRNVMGSEAAALAMGIGAGLGIAALAARGLESFLFGVSPHDVTAFVGAGVALTVVGLVATYLPARRTADVSPMEVLRAE